MIGIDEVGRGSWAGPLVVGAVYLKTQIEGLADSKTLSRVQRVNLDKLIRKHAEYSLGWVEAAEIDSLGLSRAMRLGIKRALANLDFSATEIIIDGNVNYLPHLRQARAVVGADGTVPCVSAASIVAKVARDNYMIKEDGSYPDYGFATNVGYGTRQHRQALQRLGFTPLHRLSFKPMREMANGN